MSAGSQTYMHKRQTILNEFIIYAYIHIHIFYVSYIFYFIYIYIHTHNMCVCVCLCVNIYTTLRIIKRQDYDFIR